MRYFAQTDLSKKNGRSSRHIAVCRRTVASLLWANNTVVYQWRASQVSWIWTAINWSITLYSMFKNYSSSQCIMNLKVIVGNRIIETRFKSLTEVNWLTLVIVMTILGTDSHQCTGLSRSATWQSWQNDHSRRGSAIFDRDSVFRRRHYNVHCRFVCQHSHIFEYHLLKHRNAIDLTLMHLKKIKVLID